MTKIETEHTEHVVDRALALVSACLDGTVSPEERETVRRAAGRLAGRTGRIRREEGSPLTCAQARERLARLNEKEEIRKKKGVYYTPADVVRFVVDNSVKGACGLLRPDGMGERQIDALPADRVCFQLSVFDPTCGAGEFLLGALELKLELLPPGTDKTDAARRIAATLHGNDINRDSGAITKLRLFLCILDRLGTGAARAAVGPLNRGFTCRDYILEPGRRKYDVSVGNPPYVEDGKSGLKLKKRYGKIYANVLSNASNQLTAGGAMGFVVPLSYVSTPRMRTIREELRRRVGEQYILSYSDRPDCLFTTVHQKLCILIGVAGTPAAVYTANYHYWYKEERGSLFCAPALVENPWGSPSFVPKLGRETDRAIYEKIAACTGASLLQRLGGGDNPVYLNMRATFWMKAFLEEHQGGEYRAFGCSSPEEAAYCMCLLNSSLFWWYWVCVSDCWHITKKELAGFCAPDVTDYAPLMALARQLEEKLEQTKVYVGTKQTEYIYKHRDCVKEIHQVDDRIADLFGLTAEENAYVKDFAYRYRISGGAEHAGD